VASVIEEACCAETAGALLAQRQLDVANDPEVEQALGKIAEDEARHAELGWAFVGWALASARDELMPSVVAAFERGVAQLRALPVEDASEEASRFGRLSRAEVREVIDTAITSVILPTRSRLLGSIGDA
jgi:hypothetical protein